MGAVEFRSLECRVGASPLSAEGFEGVPIYLKILRRYGNPAATSRCGISQARYRAPSPYALGLSPGLGHFVASWDIGVSGFAALELRCEGIWGLRVFRFQDFGIQQLVFAYGFGWELHSHSLTAYIIRHYVPTYTKIPNPRRKRRKHPPL